MFIFKVPDVFVISPSSFFFFDHNVHVVAWSRFVSTYCALHVKRFSVFVQITVF